VIDLFQHFDAVRNCMLTLRVIFFPDAHSNGRLIHPVTGRLEQGYNLPLTPQDFVSKWKRATAREKQSFWDHFSRFNNLSWMGRTEHQSR
jgi:hypothetical protein